MGKKRATREIRSAKEEDKSKGCHIIGARVPYSTCNIFNVLPSQTADINPLGKPSPRDLDVQSTILEPTGLENSPPADPSAPSGEVFFGGHAIQP